jgi:hypothetical protein
LTRIGFPDSLWEPLDGFAWLIAVQGHRTMPSSASFARRSLSVRRSSSSRTTPCPTLDDLDRFAELGELLDRVARRGSVRAVVFPGEFLDLGTAEALERTRRLHS